MKYKGLEFQYRVTGTCPPGGSNGPDDNREMEITDLAVVNYAEAREFWDDGLPDEDHWLLVQAAWEDYAEVGDE